MSLGGPVQPGTTYSPLFEQVAQRALARGTIIVAAAGNDSDRRRGIVAQVSHPANCPSMMAVAAVDRSLITAWFSNAGSPANARGGKVDIAGPGVDVVSDWPLPGMYKSESGTSMATPHVAGIAALLAHSNPGARGRQLMSHLTQAAKPLTAGSLDVGSGLVQAP
jgi:subtilisin